MPDFNNGCAYIGPRRHRINTEAEKNHPIFRYKDLKPEAQAKFAKWIKADSSIRTIRERAELKNIEYMLSEFNPILIKPGWKEGFSNSDFFRWKEQALSSAMFNAMYRSNPNPGRKWALDYLLCTPSYVLQEEGIQVPCRTCGAMRLPDDLDWSGDCDNCQSDGNALYNYADTKSVPTYDVSLSELRGRDRSLSGRARRYLVGLGEKLHRYGRTIHGLHRRRNQRFGVWRNQ